MPVADAAWTSHPFFQKPPEEAFNDGDFDTSVSCLQIENISLFLKKIFYFNCDIAIWISLYPFRWMCFWVQTNTRGFSLPRCLMWYWLPTCIPYYPISFDFLGGKEKYSAIVIINLYDPAISCLASTLPNHDGQLAGLGTTSPPPGCRILFLILILWQHHSIKIWSHSMSTKESILHCHYFQNLRIKVNSFLQSRESCQHLLSSEEASVSNARGPSSGGVHLELLHGRAGEEHHLGSPP